MKALKKKGITNNYMEVLMICCPRLAFACRRRAMRLSGTSWIPWRRAWRFLVNGKWNGTGTGWRVPSGTPGTPGSLLLLRQVDPLLLPQQPWVRAFHTRSLIRFPASQPLPACQVTCHLHSAIPIQFRPLSNGSNGSKRQSPISLTLSMFHQTTSN